MEILEKLQTKIDRYTQLKQVLTELQQQLNASQLFLDSSKRKVEFELQDDDEIFVFVNRQIDKDVVEFFLERKGFNLTFEGRNFRSFMNEETLEVSVHFNWNKL